MSAQRTLERLLQRAENAVSRGSGGTVSLLLSQASCPEYAQLQTLEEFDAFHGGMTLAERQGCVVLEWTRTGGDSRGLRRVTVRDVEALARFLGGIPRQSVVDAARRRLEAFEDQYPVLTTVLERWRQGKPVRSCGPEDVEDLYDAVRLAMDARQQTSVDRVLRGESVRLFGDSKRAERLVAWLDVLGSGDLAPTGLASEDIWAQFGLRRTPQPVLVSGSGQAMVGEQAVPLVRPFLGLPTDAVTQFEGTPSFVLTIENLTTFHETLRLHPAHTGWIAYTGGMPSPAWQRVYAALLTGAGDATPVYHWGDIDEGGFRIAAALQRRAAACGMTIQPWLMSPTDARRSSPEAAFRSTKANRSLAHWARMAGWDDIAKEFEAEACEIEQEALLPMIPRQATFPPAPCSSS